jgi:glycosyltransferase involved in cell wall biosynthesis
MSKVLFFCDIALANPKRGTPIHVARLLEELRAEHDLVVCAASVPDTLADIFVPYPRERGIRKLRAMLRIVDAHKIETVLTVGQVGLAAPVILKFLRGPRIVVELQGVEYIEKYVMGHIGLLYSYVWKCKSMLLLPLYDVVVAFSWRTARIYPFLRRIKIIFPAIDIDTVPQAIHHAPIPPLVVGYSGNTDPYQGLIPLVEATALARSHGLDARLHLVLTGDDAKVSVVRAHLETLGLKDVTTIIRNVSQQEAQQEMLKASVLVIPRPNVLESVYGFPSKLPECLATGLPVIVTDIGAVSELMPEIGEYCTVIPADDVAKHLAQALEHIAGMSVSLREERGRAAREYARRFNWKDATAIVSEAL